MSTLTSKYPVYEQVFDTYADKWDNNKEKSSPIAYHYILLWFSLCITHYCKYSDQHLNYTYIMEKVARVI